MMLFAANIEPGQVEAVDELLKELEDAEFNVLVCFGDEHRILTTLPGR